MLGIWDWKRIFAKKKQARSFGCYSWQPTEWQKVNKIDLNLVKDFNSFHCFYRFISSKRNNSTKFAEGHSNKAHSNDNVRRVLRPKRKDIVESIAVDEHDYHQHRPLQKKSSSEKSNHGHLNASNDSKTNIFAASISLAETLEEHFRYKTHSNDRVRCVLRSHCENKNVVESIAGNESNHQKPCFAIKKREVIQMHACENVRIGHVVLVKWPSYPYWPAIVQNITKGSAHVMFFGDNRWIAFERIPKPFSLFEPTFILVSDFCVYFL